MQMNTAIIKLTNTMNYVLTMKTKCERKKDVVSVKEWEERYQALMIARKALNYLNA